MIESKRLPTGVQKGRRMRHTCDVCLREPGKLGQIAMRAGWINTGRRICTSCREHEALYRQAMAVFERRVK